MYWGIFYVVTRLRVNLVLAFPVATSSTQFILTSGSSWKSLLHFYFLISDQKLGQLQHSETFLKGRQYLSYCALIISYFFALHHKWLMELLQIDLFFSFPAGRNLGIIGGHGAAFLNPYMTLDIRALENGTRGSRKPRYPLPHSAILVQDHPSQDM